MQRFVRGSTAVDALAALGREQRDHVVARARAASRPRRPPRRRPRPRGPARPARSRTGRRPRPCTGRCGRRRRRPGAPAPRPDAGSARSTSCTTSGSPNSSRTAASTFIRDLLSVRPSRSWQAGRGGNRRMIARSDLNSSTGEASRPRPDRRRRSGGTRSSPRRPRARCAARSTTPPRRSSPPLPVGTVHVRRAPARTGSWSTRSRPATRTPTSTSSPQGGETYRVGRDARRSAPTRGGQTIVRLDRGRRASTRVRRRATPPRAASATRTTRLGLQHDVEATPKGDALAQHRRTPSRSRRHPAPDRRHRRARAAATTRASSASSRRPQGGLEIIDVTNPRTRSRSGSPATRARRTPSTSTRSGPTSPTSRPPTRVDRQRRTARARTRTRPAPSASTSTAFEVVDLSSLHELPGGHDRRREARRVPARGLPLPLSDDRDVARPHAADGSTPSSAATSSRSTPTTCSPAAAATR